MNNGFALTVGDRVMWYVRASVLLVSLCKIKILISIFTLTMRSSFKASGDYEMPLLPHCQNALPAPNQYDSMVANKFK